MQVLAPHDSHRGTGDPDDKADLLFSWFHLHDSAISAILVKTSKRASAFLPSSSPRFPLSSNLPPPTRSHAIEMAEHEAAIIAWRDGLPERQKRRLIHPQSVTQRWRAATISPDARSPADLRRDATAAMAKILHLRRRPAAGSSHPALASRKEARGPSIRCAGCRVPRGHDGSITVTQNRELQEFSFCSILRILIKKL